jgi:HemK-related putative methylase
MIDSLKMIMRRMVNNCIRRNSLVSRLIFGVKIRNARRIHWDFTTLVLKDCLLRRVKPGQEILEVGTGPYAILSILLAKRTECNIVACDVNEMHVVSARKTVQLNGVSVKVMCSNLFDNIHNKFDIIFFNSVYIPRRVGKRLGIDRLQDAESDWCGGETGTDIIERFLKDAPAHLERDGRILLGFNARYLREDLVVKLCHGYGCDVKASCAGFPNPSRVFVLEKRR